MSSYEHFAAVTWSVDLDVNEMAEYKSISFLALSVFFGATPARIQIDFFSANGHAGCNVTFYFRLTPFKWGQTLR